MLKITKINADEMELLSKIATAILREHYDPIVGVAQNDYMLEKFQSVHAITGQIAEGYRYYWAECDGEKAGFFAIIPRGDRLYLSKLYLKKEFRGRHLARPMVDFMADVAKTEGLRSIFLNVNKHNDDSIEAYKHLGFEIIGKEKNDIGCGYYMDDFVMEKTI